MLVYEISILKTTYKTFFRFWRIWTLIAFASFSLQAIVLSITYLRGFFDPFYPAIAQEAIGKITFITSLVATPFNFIMSLFVLCWSFQIVQGNIQTFSDFFDLQKAGYKGGIKNALKFILLTIFFILSFLGAIGAIVAIIIPLLNRFNPLWASVPDVVITLLLVLLGLLLFGTWIFLCLRLNLVLYLLFDQPQSSLKEVIRQGFAKTKNYVITLLKFGALTAFSLAPMVFIFKFLSLLAKICLPHQFFWAVCLFVGTISLHSTFSLVIPILGYMYMADSIMRIHNNQMGYELK